MVKAKSKKQSKSKLYAVKIIPTGVVPPPPTNIIVENKFYRRYPDNPYGRLNYV